MIDTHWLLAWTVMTSLGFAISLYSRLSSEWEKTVIGNMIKDAPMAVCIGTVLTFGLWIITYLILGTVN